MYHSDTFDNPFSLNDLSSPTAQKPPEGTPEISSRVQRPWKSTPITSRVPQGTLF
jgi:hypothetical protein